MHPRAPDVYSISTYVSGAKKTKSYEIYHILPQKPMLHVFLQGGWNPLFQAPKGETKKGITL